VFEEALLQEAIAYRIYGGLRFFERQEIKDVLAYLRLILQPNDDAAFERVVNTPTRGIGETTLSKIRMQAREQQQPLWQTSLQMIERHTLSGRAANALGQFIDLIHNLQNNSAEMPLDQQVSYTMNASGLHAMYESDRGEKAQARLDNLQELINACKEYIAPEEAENMSPLAAFLAHATLESGETQADDFQDSVKMMTMHTAKGLEFPLVFLVGIEEGMFPSAQSREEAGRLEEERRLCYVAMTRAMQKLYISHAESRRVYGEHKYQRPSRFIKEIPADCLQEVRLRTTISRPVANRFSKLDSGLNTANEGFGLGERVVHNKFGVGMVVNYEGSGSHTRIQVNFDDLGSKWLMLEYAKLERE
jgi:DNA helicase-2/ATP-dependent DNA helicase PcrA